MKQSLMKTTIVDDHSLQNASLISAAVLSLSLMGDTLLYAVLPVAFEQFGITLAWVGVILSLNRIIRMLGANHLVAYAVAGWGYRRVVIAGAFLAVVSTAVYGLETGLLLLLVARILWGISFAALRVTSLGYAATEQEGAGKRLGWASGVQQVGPFVALIVGPWLITNSGVATTFLMIAVFGFCGVWLATRLPVLKEFDRPQLTSAWRRPTRLDITITCLGFAIDGILIVTIGKLWDLAGIDTATMVLMTAGWLASRRIFMIVFSPLAGTLADRWGIGRFFMMGMVLTIGGFVALAASQIYLGLPLIILGYGLAEILGPALATRGESEKLAALASIATWRDLGAATGALAGGFLANQAEIRVIYFALMLLLCLMLWLMRDASETAAKYKLDVKNGVRN